MPSSQHRPATPPATVEVDAGRRMLWLRFHGVVLPQHMHAQIDEMERALKDLGAGFILVTDLTGLERMDLDCVSEITRTMDLCLEAGVGRVIRIIPEPEKDIGFHLLSLVHYRGKVPSVTCATLAEAERELPIA